MPLCPCPPELRCLANRHSNVQCSFAGKINTKKDEASKTDDEKIKDHLCGMHADYLGRQSSLIRVRYSNLQLDQEAAAEAANAYTASDSEAKWNGDRASDWYQREATSSADLPEHRRMPVETLAAVSTVANQGVSERATSTERSSRTMPHRRVSSVDVSIYLSVLQHSENGEQKRSVVILFRQFVQLSQAIGYANGRSEALGRRDKANKTIIRQEADKEFRRLSKQMEYLMLTLEEIHALNT
ncbi:MAG: hypothetical protein Q9223_002980 [Gallowayella weberi]